jgi:hypothetical protein
MTKYDHVTRTDAPRFHGVDDVFGILKTDGRSTKVRILHAGNFEYDSVRS